MRQYTILTQKTRVSSVLKDTERDFGIVCLKVEMPEAEMKEIPTKEWVDEDGDDVYIPDMAREKSYEFTISVGYKGNVEEWESKVDSFMDYLTGHDNSGQEFLLYLPYHHMGRKCRLSKVSSVTPCIEKDGIIIEFSLVFKVDNPRSRVTLVKSALGNIESLNERIR